MTEFESIMWLAHKLCFDVQGDRPEIAAETIYQLALISCHYEEEDEFNVVDVKKSWPATTPFTKLPTIKMTTNEEKANINMPLMSRDSRKLVKRYIKSFDEYFGEGKVSDDRILAMTVHPFLGTIGFDELEIMRRDGKDLRARGKELLLESVMAAMKNMKTRGSANQAHGGVSTTAATASMSKLQLLSLRRKSGSTSSPSASGGPSLEQRASVVVDAFMSRKVDPILLLQRQLSRTNKGDSGIDWDRVESKDLLYISSIFDSLEWWKEEGKILYYEIFVAILGILGLPSTNAHQERTFSTCTWFDDALRQSLKEGRFEMAVLLAVNNAFLEDGSIPSEEEMKKIVEKVVRIYDNDSLRRKDLVELGLDADADDFLEASDSDADDEENLLKESD